MRYGPVVGLAIRGVHSRHRPHRNRYSENGPKDHRHDKGGRLMSSGDRRPGKGRREPSALQRVILGQTAALRQRNSESVAADVGLLVRLQASGGSTDWDYLLEHVSHFGIKAAQIEQVAVGDVSGLRNLTYFQGFELLAACFLGDDPQLITHILALVHPELAARVGNNRSLRECAFVDIPQAALRVDNGADLARVLHLSMKMSGLNPTAVSRRARIGRSQVYNLTSSPSVPRTPHQVQALLTACRLCPVQIRFLLDQWKELKLRDDNPDPLRGAGPR